ncbi:hypothetical protein AB0H12_35470 [Actinosynnema sp. NPDC023794]
MAQRVAYGRVVLGGLLAGGVLGVSQGLLHDNPWVGVAMGLLFGGTMAVVMRRTLGSTALHGLDRSQRRTVSRALRRGEPVEDSRLARPLIEQSDVVLATPFPVKSMRVVFVLLGLLGLLGLLVMVLGAGRAGVTGLPSGLLLLVLALLLLFVVIPVGRRQRERVLRSREATLERHRLPEVVPSDDR